MTCPTHATDCPGHYHYEAGLPADLALSWVGPIEARNVRTYTHHHMPPLDHPGWARLLDAINEEPRDLAPSHDDWDWPPAFHVEQFPRPDAGTIAAYNVAKVEAGGGRPQHAWVGVDPAGDYPTITAYADGTVSWSEFDGHLGVNFGAPSWHDPLQEVRDVVAKYAPDHGTMAVQQYVSGAVIHARLPGEATWRPPRPAPVPELTPPPPATGCASRGAFIYAGASWELQVWPGYPQDEMLERLNLRWQYGHPPRTPNRARRAGVRP